MTIKILEQYQSIETLPAAARALFDRVGGQRLFTSRIWFDTFLMAGMANGAIPLFLVLRGSDGGADAILPCQVAADGDAVSSLTSFYSCDFRPLIRPEAEQTAAAFALGRAVGAALRRFPVVAFDSLDAGLPILEPFLAGLSRPGRVLLRYAHFGRWWEDVAGRRFEDYLAARDGALREVVRRKGAKLEREGATFSMVGPGGDSASVDRAIADYETVYAASWKEPEPFPQFQPTLMRNLAKVGWLRLVFCHLGARPIAAQLWVVVGDTATVLKLAHDSDFARHSPGTVLTAFAIRNLIEADAVRFLDFGRGDDPYKGAWTTNRTSHIGVLSVSVAKRPGLVVRHLLGALVRRMRGSRNA